MSATVNGLIGSNILIADHDSQSTMSPTINKLNNSWKPPHPRNRIFNGTKLRGNE